MSEVVPAGNVQTYAALPDKLGIGEWKMKVPFGKGYFEERLDLPNFHMRMGDEPFYRDYKDYLMLKWVPTRWDGNFRGQQYGKFSRWEGLDPEWRWIIHTYPVRREPELNGSDPWDLPDGMRQLLESVAIGQDVRVQYHTVVENWGDLPVDFADTLYTGVIHITLSLVPKIRNRNRYMKSFWRDFAGLAKGI